jgi:8-oxo-dGTP pyrophosphatase MutT (NUDIX family)
MTSTKMEHVYDTQPLKHEHETTHSTTPHTNRSNKSAGVILVDPWSSDNVYDPSSYRVMVVQQRNSGAWGLPKGHLEKDESLLPAAHRELLEETGIKIGELVEGVDYVPLVLQTEHNTSSITANTHTNHLQIKKIHFFVYILMRRGSSLVHGEYDEKEISAVSWINMCGWFVDTPTRCIAKPQPPRFNRTLSDTSVNILMDICAKASVHLQQKFGGGGMQPQQPLWIPFTNLF